MLGGSSTARLRLRIDIMTKTNSDAIDFDDDEITFTLVYRMTWAVLFGVAVFVQVWRMFGWDGVILLFLWMGARNTTKWARKATKQKETT